MNNHKDVILNMIQILTVLNDQLKDFSESISEENLKTILESVKQLDEERETLSESIAYYIKMSAGSTEDISIEGGDEENGVRLN